MESLKNTIYTKGELCPFGDRWYLPGCQVKVNFPLEEGLQQKEKGNWKFECDVVFYILLIFGFCRNELS